MPAVRIGIVEIVSELDEQVPEPASFEKRLESFVKLSCRIGVDLAFVGEILVQLRGEEKIGLARSSFQPRFGGFLEGRPVKGVVDFDTIHEPADELKLVDSGVGIYNSLPVRV